MNAHEYLDHFFTWIIGNVGKFESHFFLNRNGKGKVHERIERDGNLVALRTHQLGLVLALEVVDDNAIVARLVDLPQLVGVLFVGNLAVIVRDFNVRFLDDTVQVLVQTVQQKRRQFL